MAPPRPYWKGYLKLSLVTCPVSMMPATSESEKVRFHTLNRRTNNRVVSRYVDAETGKEVDEEDEAKGYERGENDFLVIEDEELKSVALESVRTIDIEKFVPRNTIEWVWLEKPHYLSPSDEVGHEAFSVIRGAMEAEKVVGISRLVIGRRERAVMLEPCGKGIVVWTLRYGDEVRKPENYFGDIGDGDNDPKLMSLVTSLIEERSKPWNPDMVQDPVQEKLKKIIESKRKSAKKGAKPKGKGKDEEPAYTGNVIDLMSALKKSLEEKSGGKRK